MSESRPPVEVAALTIAGSDSCGGAGIQADLRAFRAMGVYGASVVTAVTAQNTVAVTATEAVSAEVITAQLEAVLDDLPVGAIKTGMLPDPAAIEAASEVLQRRCRDIPLIVDPVLVATSGAALTVEDTVTALGKWLFPFATLVTPNLAEARTLAGTQDAGAAGRALLALGCRAVLLKGGHPGTGTITDLLLTRDGSVPFEHAGFAGEYHGTGCALSSAIAALMARGAGLQEAVATGIDYVQSLIAHAHLPLRGKLHLLN